MRYLTHRIYIINTLCEVKYTWGKQAFERRRAVTKTVHVTITYSPPITINCYPPLPPQEMKKKKNCQPAVTVVFCTLVSPVLQKKKNATCTVLGSSGSP